MKCMIRKAQRMRIAQDLAHVVHEVFGTIEPTVAHGDNEYNRDSVRSERYVTMTSAGPIGITIDVSPRLVSVFAQFDGPMTDAMRGMALRLSGNHYSGKINFHTSPSGKATDQWCAEVAHAYRVVAEAMTRNA